MATQDHRGEVITFYSYKGGTGRSMALANVGCLLAESYSRNQRILLIDWDLEAPGLHRFFLRHLTFADSDAQALDNHPGLIELLWEFDEASQSNNQFRIEHAGEIFEQSTLKSTILTTDISGLDLLKAGRFDDSYASRVNTFDWEGLYTRARWLFPSFADFLAKNYAYVLIDSRTGISDISGVCSSLMPEKLVVVFTPNYQSLLGVLDVTRSSTEYRSQSDDLRPLAVFPLPSRIEASEPKLRDQWRYGDTDGELVGYQTQFEKLLGSIYGLQHCNLEGYFDEVQIQHVPSYAYGEDIAVLSERGKDRLSLTRSYESFTARLVTLAGPWKESLQRPKVGFGDSTDEYDVVFSYNSVDSPTVNKFAEELKKRGLRVWIDKEQIAPGKWFQDAIENALGKTKAAAVFFGPSGLGKWQALELRSFVAQCVDRGIPLIPVLLPGVEDMPPDASFLSQFQRLKIDDPTDTSRPVNQLLWGVTGKPPTQTE